MAYLTIIKYAKYAKLLKNTEICLKHYVIRIERHHINGQLPPHVHMHQLWSWVIGQRAVVPLWQRMEYATGP